MVGAGTAIVADDAELGDGASVGPFGLLGVDPADVAEPLRIGAGAVVRSHTVIYRGTTIGAGFQTGHGVLIREHTTIGDAVSVGSHSVVEHHVRIASRVRIWRVRADVPPFVLLAKRDVLEHLPLSARGRATDLATKRVFTGADAPFVVEGAQDSATPKLRELVARAMDHAEIVEYRDGVLTAWITARFPERAKTQTRVLIELAKSLRYRPDLFQPPHGTAAEAGPYR